MYTYVRYCLSMVLLLSITAAVQADVPREMSDQPISYITREARERGLMQPGDTRILRKARRGAELSPEEQARFAQLCEQVTNELGIELDDADPIFAQLQKIMSGTRSPNPIMSEMRSPKPNQPLAPGGAGQAAPSAQQSATSDSGGSGSASSGTQQNVSSSGGSAANTVGSNGFNVATSNGEARNESNSDGINFATQSGSAVNQNNSQSYNIAICDSNITTSGSDACMFNVAVGSSELDAISNPPYYSINLLADGAMITNPGDGVNVHPGNGDIRFFGDLDMQSFQINNASIGAVTASSLGSPGDVTITYDTDGTTPGTDDEGFEVRQNGTPVFRIDNDAVEITDRPLRLELSASGTNEITANEDFAIQATDTANGNLALSAAAALSASSNDSMTFNYDTGGAGTRSFEVQQDGTAKFTVNDTEIDFHDNDLSDVKSIDGGGDSVAFDNSINMNGSSIDNIGSTNTNLAGTGGIFNSIADLTGPFTSINVNTDLKILLDNQLYGDSSLFNNNSYVAPANGVYHVLIQGNMNSSGQGIKSVEIRVNGFQDPDNQFTVTNSINDGNSHVFNFSRILFLGSGDNVEFYASADAAAGAVQSPHLIVMRVA